MDVAEVACFPASSAGVFTDFWPLRSTIPHGAQSAQALEHAHEDAMRERREDGGTGSPPPKEETPGETERTVA